ncbi:phosphoenolpyruvate--protein phosphotransferase [Candidatus Margulisiibacteriota bacterium]
MAKTQPIRPGLSSRTLSFSAPIHLAAVNRGRLKEGVQLRRIRVLIDERSANLPIFMMPHTSLTGLETVRVLWEGKRRVLKLAKAKRPAATKEIQKCRPDTVFSGIGVAPGMALGSAYVLVRGEEGIAPEKYKISDGKVEEEVARFKKAVETSARHYDELLAGLRETLPQAELALMLEAHQLMINDPMFVAEVEKRIREEGWNAEYVVLEVIKDFAKTIGQTEYFGERKVDLLQIARAVIESMKGQRVQKRTKAEEIILVGEDLDPATIAWIIKGNIKVKAIVSETGGKTAHVGVIAGSLEIPAVVGVEGITRLIRDDESLLVDGFRGEVAVAPSEGRIERAREEHAGYTYYTETLRHEVEDKPSQTKDGHPVVLAANMIFPADLNLALRFGADQIGLWRTDDGVLFLGEEAQVKVYSKVGNMPAKIRTTDVGGDKGAGREVPEGLALPEMHNPFLEIRGIRLGFHGENYKKLFARQIRAMLRASANNPGLAIMFPLITEVFEFEWARQLVEQQKEALRGRFEFNEAIEIGLMVEVPNISCHVPQLAETADFFSYGSNDMLQYLKAASRTSPAMAYLYNHFALSLLMDIKGVIESAHAKEKPVCLCGDMGADPLMAILLVGLGINGLSMSATSIPGIKYVLQELEMAKAQSFAHGVLANPEILTRRRRDESLRTRLLTTARDHFGVEGFVLMQRVDTVSNQIIGQPA